MQNIQTLDHPKYRDDITGLRALAVGLIFIFHLQVDTFSGGFIGVDVFFVISGYLITRSLLQKTDSSSLKDVLLKFYARRVRRLFPALFVTVLGTIFAGYFLLGPSAFNRLVVSAWAAVFSVSNMYFLSTTGYWEPASETLPLLHTWSLGVEEQFYLIWPILILGLIAYKKRVLWACLLFLACLSFFACIKLSAERESVAFYLMPARLFQFAIGAFCILVDDQNWLKNKLSLFFQHAIFCAGLMAIISSALLFDADTTYPGVLALIPTLGSAALIVSRSPKYFHYILENPVFNWIGLTSYSIYLVHWPVIVFLQMHFVTLPLQVQLIAVALTLVFSTLQYYFVENHYRRGDVFAAKGREKSLNVLALSFACLPILGFLGLLVNQYTKQDPKAEVVSVENNTSSPPAVGKTNKEMRTERYAKYSTLCRNAKQLNVCGNLSGEKQNVVIVGDSHSVQWFNTLTYAYPNLNFLASSVNGCILTVDFKSSHKCHQPNRERLDFLVQNKSNIHTLVIANRHYARSVQRIQKTTEWAKNIGLNVIIMGPGLELTQPYQDLVERLNGHDILMKNIEKYRYIEPKEQFENATPYILDLNAIILDPLEYFCPHEICTLSLSDNSPILLDSHHISLPASLAYGEYLKTKRPGLF